MTTIDTVFPTTEEWERAKIYQQGPWLGQPDLHVDSTLLDAHRKVISLFEQYKKACDYKLPEQVQQHI